MGKTVINVNPAFPGNPALAFVGFIVDDTHVKIIERERVLGITGGVAIAQGAATGTFTTASLSGPVVFGTQGYSGALQPTVYAGMFTATSGNLSAGSADENAGGTVTTGTLTGTYAADSSKTGRVTTSLLFNSVAGPSLIFYLTGATDTPALILQVDASPFIETVGTIYTQAPGPFNATSFSGPYGSSFAAFPTGLEYDGTGQVAADGVSALGPGNADVNYHFVPQVGQVFLGTFTGFPTTGRFTGTLTTTGAGSTFAFTSSPMAFYMVDSTRVVFIETDSQPALGVFRQQQQ